MPDFAGQIERRLKEKKIDATVAIDSYIDSVGRTTINVSVILEHVDRKYGYSTKVTDIGDVNETVVKKELAIAADQIAKKITKDFSTYMEYKGRTIFMVEDLSETIRIQCLSCDSRVKLERETIRKPVQLFPTEEPRIGEVSSFKSRDGYDSLTEEEKSIGKLYMIDKLENECECDL